MLISASFITTLLSRFCCQKIIDYRLFRVIGIFRHQFFNLLIVAFCQLEQSLLGLLTCTAALATHKPAARMRTGAENTAQQPFNRKQNDHGDDQDDHQTRHAGFNVVVVCLDQHVSLMTGDHWADDDPGDQQHKEQ
ncbi:hypothetical protein D3C73_1051810 [compost metagenome]